MRGEQDKNVESPGTLAKSNNICMVGESHSCDICGKIMSAIMHPSIEWVNEEPAFHSTDPVNCGWLDFIIDNQHKCSLCRLIARIFEQTRMQDHNVNDDLDKIFCNVAKASVQLSATGKRRNWVIELDFFYPAKEQAMVPSKWRPAFRLLTEDKLAIGTNEDVFELGQRLAPGYWNPSFVRDCFNKCIHTHGDACDRPVERAFKTFSRADSVPLPKGMRIINVKEQRVVDVPATGCDYAILSYVWGSTNFLTLTHNTKEQLQTAGILKIIRVPKTIANAIEAADKIGIQYLWVDALCILQDDMEEKVSQINKMDIIYANAMVTIIAAASTHADDGLWSDESKKLRSQQPFEEINGLRFIGAGPGVVDLIEWSVWKQRAWTYQELVLSRRFIVFGEFQTYYSCEVSSSAEDLVYRASPLSDAVESYEIAVPANEQLCTEASIISGFPVDWTVLIRDYSIRNLSFDSDSLHAVSGVMQNYRRGIDDGFLCGLPVSMLLEAGMLWYASRVLRRRGPTTSGTLFPSWSWAGWVGQVVYNLPVEKDLSGTRVVKGWKLKHKDGVLNSTDLHFPSSAGQLCASVPEETWKAANESLPEIQTGLLCFKTQSAMFTVGDTSWNQLAAADDYDCENNGLYRIFDQKNTWVGSVHLEHLTAQSLPVGHSHTHEFIVLSRSSDQYPPWWVTERPLTDENNAVALYDEGLLTQYEADVYNVMLITNENGFSIRRGIGQIHMESWDKANWKTRDIELA